METNKLLTLEEIEEIEKGVGKHYMTVKADVAFDLLTAARAYWDLKEPAEAPVATSSYRGFGSDEYDQNQRALKEAFEKGRASAERELKDKPHDAIELATFMHDFYEDASAKAGWETQKKCRVPFSELPENNQFVMIRMANALIKRFESMNTTARLPELADDKPHARTIEAMIEALVKARNKSWNDVTGDYEFGAFVHHLESILQDLNN